MSWTRVASTLACVAAVGAGGQEPLGRSVIAPSGFEEGMGSWQRVYGRPALDTDVAHTGSGSLRLDDGGAVRTERLPLGGACWKLSAWVKTRDVQRGDQPWHRAGVQVTFYDADGKPGRHYEIGQTLGTTDWTRHETTIYAPPKAAAAFATVALQNWNCTGTTWFDDIELVTAPIPEAYVKVPPRVEVENGPPRHWTLPPVRKAARADLPQALFPGRDLPVHIVAFEPLDSGERVEEGLDIDRGYMTRFVRRAGPGPGPDGWREEQYFEVFRGSPIASWFRRVWLPGDAETGELACRVALSAPVARLRWYDGNRMVEAAPPRAIELGEKTTKPFVIVSNEADDAGVVLLHPIPPEIRRWYIEDYIVEQELPARIEVVQREGATAVEYSFGAARTGAGGYCHSFDFYVFAMPYVGSVEEALAQFQLGRSDLLAEQLPFSANEPRGYWEPFMTNASGARLSRMARYFPREFSSWMASSGWDYGREGGHGWGCTTAMMKGIRVNGLAESALARDYAWRMLTFFLEASGPTGAPPHMYTWRSAAAKIDDPGDRYTTVFCQYWEWRLEEFRAWLRDSALLTAEEKERIYEDLQRARLVYDPANEDTTWTYDTPNGGYWFEYQDKPRGLRRWVINTHTTSVGVVGDFALIARDLGKSGDHEYWKRLFERGVDGLIWAWEQPGMWTDWDADEVRYAMDGGGPRGYHGYMVTAWTPKVMRLDAELGGYRLPDLVRYWERMASAEYTAQDEARAKRVEELRGWIEENVGQQ